MQMVGFLVALTGYCVSSILLFEAGQKQDSARSVCGILPLSVSLTPGPGVCLDLRAKAAVSPAGHSALKGGDLKMVSSSPCFCLSLQSPAHS